jgi:hypothetical protein
MRAMINYPPFKSAMTAMDALTDLGVIIGDSILFSDCIGHEGQRRFNTTIKDVDLDEFSRRRRDTVVVIGMLEKLKTVGEREHFMQVTLDLLADDGWAYYVTTQDYPFFDGWTKLANGPGFNIWTTCTDDNNEFGDKGAIKRGN